MAGDIGSQMFDANPLPDFTQPAIRVRQHLMRSVISLLFRPMHTTVEYRKNIIFIRLSLLLVFDNDIPHFLRQQKIDRLARFLANVVHPSVPYISVFQQGDVCKVNPRTEIAEHENIPCQSFGGIALRQIECNNLAHVLFRDGPFLRPRIEFADFIGIERVIVPFHQLQFYRLVEHATQRSKELANGRITATARP